MLRLNNCFSKHNCSLHTTISFNSLHTYNCIGDHSMLHTPFGTSLVQIHTRVFGFDFRHGSVRDFIVCRKFQKWLRPWIWKSFAAADNHPTFKRFRVSLRCCVATLGATYLFQAKIKNLCFVKKPPSPFPQTHDNFGKTKVRALLPEVRHLTTRQTLKTTTITSDNPSLQQ